MYSKYLITLSLSLFNFPAEFDLREKMDNIKIYKE